MALLLGAIEQGFGAYFLRAYDLMENLHKARAEHNLDRRMRVYLAPKVLIVDEFGVWPYDREPATAFFILVSALYERGSMILTSNKGFGEWGELLEDTVTTSAILDWLLHHPHVLSILGESYRSRTSGKLESSLPIKSWGPVQIRPKTNQRNPKGVKSKPAMVTRIHQGGSFLNRR